MLVHTAAAEVGQGLVTLQAQIARTELGVGRVTVAPADTDGRIGRLVQRVAPVVHDRRCRTRRLRGRTRAGAAPGRACRVPTLTGGQVVARRRVGRRSPRCSATGSIEETREFHHRPTTPLDPVTGQGDSHTQFAFCVHRAVVDVDVELGLVKVVELAAVQDVGKILNPISLEGQIHGGTAQGLGLALMEEIQVEDGRIRNPSFTDYLIPTILDMPPMSLEILENPDPHAPYGLRGAGEPPTLSSTPAIVAAVRDACGAPLWRVPVRPQHILGSARTRRIPA